MRKNKVINPRYPHAVRIIRVIVGDNPFEDFEEQRVVYEGAGRSYTDTTTTGDSNMDTNRRKASIPMRYDAWKEAVLDGDTIEVEIGEMSEKGVVRDMETDNDRTIIYWEYGRVQD